MEVTGAPISDMDPPGRQGLAGGVNAAAPPTYALSNSTATFQNISTTGTLVALTTGTTDDGGATIPIGFNFNYYGNTYTR